MRLLLASTLVLAACGSPCASDGRSCTEGFDHGEAPFGANPWAVEGRYVPALAGCTKTSTFESGTQQIERWDHRGRRVYLEVVGGGVMESIWDGPCMEQEVARQTNPEQTTYEQRTCGPEGWPLTMERWAEGERGNVVVFSSWTYDDVFEGKRRVGGIHTLQVDPPEDFDVVVEWRDGRPIRETITGVDYVEENEWSWDDDHLVGTRRFADGELLHEPHRQASDFVYDALDRLTRVEFEGASKEWSYAGISYWPTREDSANGVVELDFDCP